MGVVGLILLFVEMVSKGGVGFWFDLDCVFCCEEVMILYEMMLFES